jgi:hypothetical protein
MWFRPLRLAELLPLPDEISAQIEAGFVHLYNGLPFYFKIFFLQFRHGFA